MAGQHTIGGASRFTFSPFALARSGAAQRQVSAGENLDLHRPRAAAFLRVVKIFVTNASSPNRPNRRRARLVASDGLAMGEAQRNARACPARVGNLRQARLDLTRAFCLSKKPHTQSFRQIFHVLFLATSDLHSAPSYYRCDSHLQGSNRLVRRSSVATLAEQAQFFAFEPAKLRGRAVLDVAAGPASSTAEACKLGADAVAVDPLYGCPASALRDAPVQLDYAKMFEQMRAKPHLLRLKSFPSIEAAEIDRRTAARRFLDDDEAQFAHRRYVGRPVTQAAVSRWRLRSRARGCAACPPVYAQRFDLSWHVTACRELVRAKCRRSARSSRLWRRRSALPGTGCAAVGVRGRYGVGQRSRARKLPKSSSAAGPTLVS